MVVLTLKAKHDHLQRVASTRDYVKALAEFVWNALDADAAKVSVDFYKNVLGGLDSIVIRDTGTGISRARAEHDFESVGESWKLQANHTPVLSRALHGKEGRGRLRFFSLAHRAHWTSVYEEDGRFLRIDIEINAATLHESTVSEPQAASADAEIGTVVELAPLKDTFDWLTSEGAWTEFNATFAPYILQYPDTVIIYNGQAVNPKVTVDREYIFEPQPVVCPGRVVRDLSLRIIEWRVKVGSRRIYFGGESGVVLGSQAANVTAPEFDFSIYAYSQFF